MSGWNIPDFLFAADEIDDLKLSQACETIEILELCCHLLRYIIYDDEHDNSTHTRIIQR
jgi:hypothetical protein